MRYFMVTARYVRHDRQWSTAVGIPTFFLREDMQLILNSAGAAKIARAMVREMASAKPEDIHGEVIDTDSEGNPGTDYAQL